jgi:hypothetical protein
LYTRGRCHFIAGRGIKAKLEACRWDEAKLVAGRCNKAKLKLADRKTRRNWKESGGIGVCIKGVVN